MIAQQIGLACWASFVSQSSRVRARVDDLIRQEKNAGLSAEEKSELDNYLQLEHLMRLANARAYLSHEQ